MLLNRESNPGLPRLVVSNHMTTGGLLVIVPWDLWIRSDAYAEIIATRPLGIVTNSNSLMVVFHGYLPLAKYLEIRIRAGLCQSTSSWLTSKVPSWRDLLVTKLSWSDFYVHGLIIPSWPLRPNNRSRCHARQRRQHTKGLKFSWLYIHSQYGQSLG